MYMPSNLWMVDTAINKVGAKHNNDIVVVGTSWSKSIWHSCREKQILNCLTMDEDISFQTRG